MGSKVKILRPDKASTFQRDGLKTHPKKKEDFNFFARLYEMQAVRWRIYFSYKVLLIEGYILFVLGGSNLK
ncbi:hypothetical protein VNF293_41020 [Atlantibacter hermannii]